MVAGRRKNLETLRLEFLRLRPKSMAPAVGVSLVNELQVSLALYAKHIFEHMPTDTNIEILYPIRHKFTVSEGSGQKR